MSNKYGEKLVHTAKKSATDAIKTASQRAIQKPELTTLKKRYISPEERQQITDELRLIPKD